MKQSRETIVSVRDAAAILGIHPWTVREWASSQRIPSHRSPGGHRLFVVEDLLSYRRGLVAAEKAGAALGRKVFILAHTGGR